MYEALHDLHRAALLNIAAKSFRILAEGTEILPHITLDRVQQDRCYARVPRELMQLVKKGVGDSFEEASGGLHKIAGFKRQKSFKSKDGFGNLQLTFFKKRAIFKADVDIDDAAGLGHVFQVLRNWVTNGKTHPYDIHQILIKHQDLPVPYDLRPI